MQRHLYAFVHLALDHRTHKSCRNTNDLRFVFRDGELEVFDKVDDDSLQLDDSVDVSKS